MKDLILVGAGGCMREILWQIEELNKKVPTWNIRGIVDKMAEELPPHIYGYPVLGDDSYLLNLERKINAAICLGNSDLRREIAETLSDNPNILFPPIILDYVKLSDRAFIGQGCILCTDSIISVDTHLGDFILVNMGTLISHDGVIENYATLNSGTRLAGNVTLGECSELGIGSTVIQGITIGEHTIVGAGAVVVRDLPSFCTAVGVPAKVIKGDMK